MPSKAVGYYVSVEKKTKRNGRDWYDFQYQSRTFPDKQTALKWAYLALPVTKEGWLMRAHEDSDDDEIKGRLRWLRRVNGDALIFEDEDVIYYGYGNTYDVSDKGTLKRKR